MKIFKQTDQLPSEFRDSILTIGNFDGMHKGHLALINETLAFAKQENRPVGVLTFEPHPRSVFQPHESPFRITPQDVKREKISDIGVDFLIELEFTRELAQKSADEFVQDILIDLIGTHQVFIGQDFHFGRNRTGSIDTIQANSVKATAVKIIEDKHSQKYSASQVRSHLRRGMISEANAILGWEWDIKGTVIHGDKRGREMGFPTANILLGETIHPAFGVYATMVRIEGEDQWRPAATNIGIRPMFETSHALVEAHLLNFEGDLYDKKLHVKPIQKIRDEARYKSLEELIAQIERDCLTIEETLKRTA